MFVKVCENLLAVTDVILHAEGRLSSFPHLLSDLGAFGVRVLRIELNVLFTVHHSKSVCKTVVTHFSFNLLRIKVSTCFEHYLLILGRRYTATLGIFRACYVSCLYQGQVL
jgi:hypothetical protein